MRCSKLRAGDQVGSMLVRTSGTVHGRPEIDKGLGRKGKGDVNSPYAFQRYQQIREIPGRLFQDRKRKSFPRLDVGATTSSSQR